MERFSDIFLDKKSAGELFVCGTCDDHDVGNEGRKGEKGRWLMWKNGAVGWEALRDDSSYL